MVKAVLLDLDGTLADTLADLATATNTVLAKDGLPTHPVQAYRRFVGDGARVLMERASGMTDGERFETLFQAFLAEYDRRCLEQVCAYDGVLDTLDRLLDAGLKLAVVTNKPHAQAVKLVDHLFPNRFSCIYGGQAAYPKKPDPTSALLAAKALDVSPAECVFVGDSDVDVMTAHAVGMPCVGCCYGFRGEGELKSAGADELIGTFDELQYSRYVFG